jgi:Ca2+-transporting ATPase
MNAEETEKSASGAEGKRRHPYDFSIDQPNVKGALSAELQNLFNEQFAKELDWRNARETREAVNVVQIIPFSSERKSMGVVIKMLQGEYHAYFKGASEILNKRSNKYIVVRQDGNYSHGIETKDIDELFSGEHQLDNYPDATHHRS